ncbi:hypothetical protein GCM10010266_58200 [Streptomyces griseomycini]|uniref:hypothetical protein n=1 Tax=Streptomyces griseomycini TaxID=66895 RepID=UPI00199F717F|nr:hypothetical protein [Streptomyces griseomycini]GGQ27289.1 hypothetical protein GCM10010266_58200 [Streptomyces griseomycini]
MREPDARPAARRRRAPSSRSPGACRLNLQEGWWRIFRKTALVGRSFAGPPEIDQATRLATPQLSTRARP